MDRRWFRLKMLLFILVGTTASLTAQTNVPGSLASARPPVYPLAAEAAGIAGKVVLQGVIGKDGAIRDLQVVRGPAQLQQAAIDAVMQWKYHPYTDDHGQLVDTKTTVNVTFKLGNKKQKAAAEMKAKAILAGQSASSAPGQPGSAKSAPNP